MQARGLAWEGQLDDQGADRDPGRDLVMIALPGVQKFIAEARSTSDVRAASQIYARLAARAAEECQRSGGDLVFPSGGAKADSMPRSNAMLRGASCRVAPNQRWAIPARCSMDRSAKQRPCSSGTP